MSRDDAEVGGGEGLRESHGEIAGTGIEVGLEDGHPTFRPGIGRTEQPGRRRDLSRVIRVSSSLSVTHSQTPNTSKRLATP